MLDLDIRTLYYIFSLANFFVIPFFVYYFISFHIRSFASKLFLLSRIGSVVGVTFIVLRGYISPFLSITIGNILLIFGLTYEVFSIIHINKKYSSKKFIYLNILTLFFIICFLFFVNLNEGTRILVFSLIALLIYSIGFYIYTLEKNLSKTQKISAFLFLLTAIVYLIRILAIISTSGDAFIFENNIIQVISLVYLLLFTFSAPIIIVLILKEEDNLKLTKLNNNKTQFFRIIAHDLRGPLGTLSKLGQLLWEKKNTIDDDTKIKLKESIYKTSKDSFTLLDNLLKWASTNLDDIVYEPSKLNLKKISDDLVSFFTKTADLKQIKLFSEIKDDLYIYADKNMVETIIRNLLSNAIKFTPKNGKVSIIKEIQPNSTNNHIIKIVDNGIGMSKEVVDEVFEFDSYKSTRGTENEKGTGVGLNLCKEFIKKNKGKIWIESKENKGTTIFVSFPKYE